MVYEWRDSVVTCSKCGLDFDEVDVNCIDYDLDLCNKCEKEYIKNLENQKQNLLKKKEINTMLEFSKDKIAGTVKVEFPLTEDHIFSIIVGSFEGGSNYWLGLDTLQEDWKERPENEPSSTWATKLLLEGKTLHFFDVENPEEKWTLTLGGLLKGISLNYKDRPHDTSIENGDRITYDCIMQYALLGEIVYS